MCAMMPILRNFFKSCLAISKTLGTQDSGYRSQNEQDGNRFYSEFCILTPSLPFVMRESLVGLRHAVRVLFLLDRIAAIVRRVEQFSCEAVGHSLFAAPARVLHNPANGQRAATLLVNLNRHLIGRTADASRLDLDG